MSLRLASLIVMLSLVNAAAVVVSGPDGTINTNGTGAGDGWNYVGGVNGASGIYLGEYDGGFWVLGAAHVGPGNLILNSNTYTYQSGSVVTIYNPDNSPSDLIVFRITTQPPGLDNLALAESTAISDEVIMIGNGRNRAASETTWYVDTGTSPYVWTTTMTASGTTPAQGYSWASGNTKRWGENVVSGTSTIAYSVSGTMRTVHTVDTDFDNIDGEGQAAVGDSGGGLFHFNNNGTSNPNDDFWELTGVMVTIGTFSGQPGETAVYGNLTYSADISFYRDQILAAVPEPAGAVLTAAGLTVIALNSRRRRREGS